MQPIDLHVHSNKSDGSFTPAELVDYAKAKGLSAFALTDHDTVEGIPEALQRAKEVADGHLEVIPGVEISTEYLGRDVHIVGLYIDYTKEDFVGRLKEYRDNRDTRNQKICALLQADGIDVSFEGITAENPDSVLTRLHFAKYLLKHGYVASLDEAFDRYVGDHCKYFVPREKITPAQGVQLILSAGGIPILAHPMLYSMSKKQLETLVQELKAAGLVGIEAVYSTYSPSEERYVRELAAQYDLLLSGGSDFHGTGKPGLDLAVGYGKLFVPEELLITLKDWKNVQKISKRSDEANSSINTTEPSMVGASKILFTDLDGTLLNDQKQITPATHEAIRRWLSSGNVLVLSSGRPLGSILQVIEENQIAYDANTKSYHPNLYAIGYNGALIYHVASKEKLWQEALRSEELSTIAQIAEKHGIFCQAYDDTHILVPRESEELAFYRRTVHLPYRVLSDFPGALKEPPCKFLFICLERQEPDRLTEVGKEIMSVFPETITCTKSNPYLLEVFSSKCGKGNAVKRLCELLSIPVSKAYAAGDELNDLSMLEAAGTGIAMCNGNPALFAQADVITKKSNNEDGLADYLLSIC